MARLTITAHRQATVHLQLTARHPPTFRLQPMARRLATTCQRIMAHHLITVRRHFHRAQFRMPFRRYGRRVICGGDAVREAVGGGGCAIRRSLRDLTAAMVRHLVQAITAPIEVIYLRSIRTAQKYERALQRICLVPV